jgi:hypothetical protein
MSQQNVPNNCGLDSKILTLSFLSGKCDEKLYRLNLALNLIGQFMWAEQIKSYNGNTIDDSYASTAHSKNIAVYSV